MISEEFSHLTVPADTFDARPAIASLLRYARERRASDLHLSPRADQVELSLRQDGVLRQQAEISPEVYQRLVVGIKNMAKLASYKKSLPQDGSMRVEDLEVRVATAPTVFGERIVMRLLARSSQPPELAKLGFTQVQNAALQTLVDRPQGLILTTGPAGSGKTTTLLALMRWLYQEHRRRLSDDSQASLSVVTLEDPVEFVVPEFHQTEIAEAMGMTFAEGLRSLLRQDPELVLVGEIRDSETAKAAVQAGLSGHLVFSTLHAGDAVGVIPRLQELGVAPYQLCSALAGIISQRLLRKVCPGCRGRGCRECDQSGYKGRVPIAEILTFHDDLAQLVLDQAPLSALRSKARELGMRTLREAALERSNLEETDPREVQRVLG